MEISFNPFFFAVYVDIGANSGDTATINFNFGTTAASRTYDIKVTQIECTNPNRW